MVNHKKPAKQAFREDLEKTVPAERAYPRDAQERPPAAGVGGEEGLGAVEREVNQALERLLAQVDSEMRGAVERELTSSEELSGLATGLPQHRHLSFTLAATRYAVPLANVLEIGTIPEMTPVPNLPDWVVGVTNLRGEIFSVVDIRAFLKIGRCERLKENRMVVLRTMDDALRTAFLVDQINGILSIAPDQVHGPRAPLESTLQPFLEGIHNEKGRLVVVLSMDRLLKAPSFQATD